MTAAHTGSILVVDDDPINRMLLSRSLVADGHTVRTAEHGVRALELLAEARDDVVLLDIVMPEMDGIEVLEAIKADPKLRDLPVIMISGLDDYANVVRCIEAGAEDYLPKPFDPVLLRARIAAGLDKRHVHELEHARVRDVFARFLPESMVDQVLVNGDQGVRLGGVRPTNADSNETFRHIVAAPARAPLCRGVDPTETGCFENQFTAFQELFSELSALKLEADYRAVEIHLT